MHQPPSKPKEVQLLDDDFLLDQTSKSINHHKSLALMKGADHTSHVVALREQPLQATHHSSDAERPNQGLSHHLPAEQRKDESVSHLDAKGKLVGSTQDNNGTHRLSKRKRGNEFSQSEQEACTKEGCGAPRLQATDAVGQSAKRQKLDGDSQPVACQASNSPLPVMGPSGVITKEAEACKETKSKGLITKTSTNRHLKLKCSSGSACIDEIEVQSHTSQQMSAKVLLEGLPTTSNVIHSQAILGAPRPKLHNAAFLRCGLVTQASR